MLCGLSPSSCAHGESQIPWWHREGSSSRCTPGDGEMWQQHFIGSPWCQWSQAWPNQAIRLSGLTVSNQAAPHWTSRHMAGAINDLSPEVTSHKKVQVSLFGPCCRRKSLLRCRVWGTMVACLLQSAGVCIPQECLTGTCMVRAASHAAVSSCFLCLK